MRGGADPDAPGTLTDADGRFVLGPLPPGQPDISAAKTGFVKASVTASDNVDVRLTKGGVITGHVLDDLGEPMPLMNVVAVRRHAVSGHVTFDRVASADTDDLGEYRLFGLAAGEYVVATAPGRLATATSSIPIAVENLVLRLYYGPADTPERARPLAVGPGEEVPGIDFTFPLPPIDAIRPEPAPRARPGSSGAIRGRVLRADGLPVRRGRVQLISGDDLFSPYAVATDDEGRYEFANLQAGTYLVSATTLGASLAIYGQRGPADRGSLLTLKAGEAAEGIDMTLMRGGAISGRILDEYGDPMENANVRVERIEFSKGRRRLVSAPGIASRQTNDQGRYRIFGLPPGRYLVSAVVGETVPGWQTADYPGYARTYFPGTPVPAEAQTLEIAQGQQTLTIDVTLARGRVARIAGTARTADGAPLHGVMALTESYRSGALATATRSVRTSEDGGFEFARLPPGEYVMQAATSRATVSTEGESGARFVTVDGVDVTGLDVRLSRGSTIEGRLAFEDADPPDDPDFHISPVPADPDLTSLVDNAPARADIHDGWTFEITGISGPRRLQLTQAPDGWALKAVRVNGVDVTDVPLLFGTADQSLRDVEVVLTKRISTLTIVDAAASGGAPADFRVIAFAADTARRYPGSRYVALGVPGHDGVVTLRGLPPGEYYVAAIGRHAFVDNAVLDEGERLESLAAGAASITLTEGERRSVSVNVIGR